MQKYRDNNEIKSFEFADLKGTHVVGAGNFEAFSFKQLHGDAVNSEKVTDAEIRNERSFAQKNNFKIDSVVKDSRGLSRQEQTDVEKAIQAEVEKRMAQAYEDAYQEGLEKGRLEGKEEAEAQYHEVLGQKVEEFTQILGQIQHQSAQIMTQSKKEVYDFVKRFTKWIVLKEINEKVYLEQLLEKLILELNARKNLIVKVGQGNFAQMPEVLKTVEARLGQLQNVRIEIVPEILHPGIILEGENGLIDGSMEGVFKNIDRIFEQVIGHE